MDTYTIERIYLPLIDQSNAINAAASKEVTRDIMASFYEDCLIADTIARQRNKRRAEEGDNDLEGRVDFKAVNNAILARWPKGLDYIKGKAWKALEARCQSGPDMRSEYA